MRKSILAVAAAISMISLSSGAVAQSAAALSVQPLSLQSNAGADLQDANSIRGGFILPTIGILAIVAVIYLLTKGGDDPASP